VDGIVIRERRQSPLSVTMKSTRTTSAADPPKSDNVPWFDLEQDFGDDFYLAKVEWLKNNTPSVR
jgi:hypothetical protein